MNTSDHARENLLRLMAAGGLSLSRLAEQTGLNVRTIRGILRGGHRPHARTLHRLAEGLGVSVDEFFVDPAQLLYRRFDRQTNPLVAEVVADHKELFAGWSEADFDELHSRVGTGGALTVEGAVTAVRQMNRKRRLAREARSAPGKQPSRGCRRDSQRAVREGGGQWLVEVRERAWGGVCWSGYEVRRSPPWRGRLNTTVLMSFLRRVTCRTSSKARPSRKTWARTMYS